MIIKCPLFVPADSQKKLDKAINTNADCLFIDLEDSVVDENKQNAREIARQFIKENKQTKMKLYVRINALNTKWCEDDIKIIMEAKPHGIILPKSQSGMDVSKLDAILRVYEFKNKIEDGKTRIIAIITETALATLQAGQYKDASERLVAMAWGGEDLSVEVGAKEKRKKNGEYNDMLRFARIQTLLGAIAADVQPLDAIYDNIKDQKGLKKECEQAYRDGFKGKMAIHPNQIDIIKNAFTPSKNEIEKAQKIIKEFKKNKNIGVIQIDGKMLDKPHLINAQNIIKQKKQ